MTAPDLDALERAAQAADWTVNAASYAASWAFEKLATPAAVRAIIARLREAERQRDEARAALETISESHIPSMPMTAADDELVWAQRHVAHLRRIALSALPPPAGSETGEA